MYPSAGGQLDLFEIRTMITCLAGINHPEFWDTGKECSRNLYGSLKSCCTFFSERNVTVLGFIHSEVHFIIEDTLCLRFQSNQMFHSPLWGPLCCCLGIEWIDMCVYLCRTLSQHSWPLSTFKTTPTMRAAPAWCGLLDKVGTAACYEWLLSMDVLFIDAAVSTKVTPHVNKKWLTISHCHRQCVLSECHK